VGVIGRSSAPLSMLCGRIEAGDGAEADAGEETTRADAETGCLQDEQEEHKAPLQTLEPVPFDDKTRHPQGDTAALDRVPFALEPGTRCSSLGEGQAAGWEEEEEEEEDREEEVERGAICDRDEERDVMVETSRTAHEVGAGRETSGGARDEADGEAAAQEVWGEEEQGRETGDSWAEGASRVAGFSQQGLSEIEQAFFDNPSDEQDLVCTGSGASTRDAGRVLDVSALASGGARREAAVGAAAELPDCREDEGSINEGAMAVEEMGGTSPVAAASVDAEGARAEGAEMGAEGRLAVSLSPLVSPFASKESSYVRREIEAGLELGRELGPAGDDGFLSGDDPAFGDVFGASGSVLRETPLSFSARATPLSLSARATPRWQADQEEAADVRGDSTSAGAASCARAATPDANAGGASFVASPLASPSLARAMGENAHRALEEDSREEYNAERSQDSDVPSANAAAGGDREQDKRELPLSPGVTAAQEEAGDGGGEETGTEDGAGPRPPRLADDAYGGMLQVQRAGAGRNEDSGVGVHAGKLMDGADSSESWGGGGQPRAEDQGLGSPASDALEEESRWRSAGAGCARGDAQEEVAAVAAVAEGDESAESASAESSARAFTVLRGVAFRTAMSRADKYKVADPAGKPVGLRQGQVRSQQRVSTILIHTR